MFTKSSKILVSLDPVLVRVLNSMAKQREQPRAEMLRDVIYTLVWTEKREGKRVQLQRAPLRPPEYETWESNLRSLRYVHDTYKLVKIDQFGLAIDPPRVYTSTEFISRPLDDRA